MRRVVVTRPQAEAQRWLSALQAQGWTTLALPLLEILPLEQQVHQQPLPLRLADADAWMFVSVAAVQHFFAVRAAKPAVWPRCWAPGPATARALELAGVPVDSIDQPSAQAAQYDSEALWQVVQHQVGVGHRLCVVRGQSVSSGQGTEQGHGRDWLAQQCVARGGQVDWCVAYRRGCPTWDAEQVQQAQSALHDGSIWLLSSSEAIRHLPTLLPHGNCWSAPALVTHPRMVDAARQVGFQSIHVSRPTLPDVLAGLEKMRY